MLYFWKSQFKRAAWLLSGQASIKIILLRFKTLNDTIKTTFFQTTRPKSMSKLPKVPLILAIVQKPAAYLDIEKSLSLAEEYVQQAASKGARLIVFGETWFGGYPAWIDHLPAVALWDYPPTKEVYARMLQNGVEVKGTSGRFLADLARRYQVHLVAGINEIVSKGYGNGSLFNSLLFYGPDGSLLNHHRKLMPTFTEKLLYAAGDGHGLKTADTPFGSIGGLICWEHWMPLSRQALHMQNEHIHVAVWPAVKDLHQMASRHYAFEGRCYVIAAGQILQVKDLPEMLTLPETLKKAPDQYLLNGGSSVIGPDGAYILEPQFDMAEILYITIEDWESTLRERMTLDVSGHYYRPDVFDFQVNDKRNA
jgi:nitrilase